MWHCIEGVYTKARGVASHRVGVALYRGCIY